MELGRDRVLLSSQGAVPGQCSDPTLRWDTEREQSEKLVGAISTISVIGLSSVLPIRATALCLHCRECSLLCPAAELHELQVMT